MLQFSHARPVPTGCSNLRFFSAEAVPQFTHRLAARGCVLLLLPNCWQFPLVLCSGGTVVAAGGRRGYVTVGEGFFLAGE